MFHKARNSHAQMIDRSTEFYNRALSEKTEMVNNLFWKWLEIKRENFHK